MFFSIKLALLKFGAVDGCLCHTFVYICGGKYRRCAAAD